MTEQKNRVLGGQIDRAKPINFSFNGRQLQGYQGDTLASALLANDIHFVGRSFKYHRPRGIFSAGSEEPNALMTLHEDDRAEPNCRASVVEIFEGLKAKSQNHKGSLERDLLAVNDLLSPFLGTGFYYKTFMWPKAFWEKLYEPFIRSAAGLGVLSDQPDPDVYDHGYLHCDLLIIGGGATGLSAALAAGRAGARVILADEDFALGGRLNADQETINEQEGRDWVLAAISELSAMNNVRLMTRTTVYGAFDHGTYGALERKGDHLPPTSEKPRQVVWRIYTKQALLAAGATERSIAFGNNDRPAIMLSGAVRQYLNRFGVAAGQKIAIFTNNDDGLRTEKALQKQNIDVVRIIDTRKGEFVIDTKGRKRIQHITLNNGEKVEVDCLAVSGGWSPNVQLTCHQRGRPLWRDDIAAFVPGEGVPSGMVVAGAAKGDFSLRDCLENGHEAAAKIASALGYSTSSGEAAKAANTAMNISAFWHVKESKARCWLDLQNDVSVKDVLQARKEGYTSPELFKRYTTLGMATDQGKTSNVLALGAIAQNSGMNIEDIGTTIFRPPYSPVSLGALAGRARGKEFRPTRYTPSHNWAQENGASFTEVGQWYRAEWFTQKGEKGWRDSVDREVLAVRNGVGICDVSTLGKIDVQGKDAAEFLNRLYANAVLKIPVGKVRYGIMLREDGFCYDDGTVARMRETHFIVTTTTANAGLVYREMEFAAQCLWPSLDVHLISTTDAWAQFAIAGPQSRAVLSKVVDDLDLSNEAFPFMACSRCSVFGGIPARLFRISFSGELAYEIAVPRRFGDSFMRALMEAGQEFDLTPYGLEALNVLRIEKGHPTGNELNGQTTAAMLGLSAMVSSKKDYIGAHLHQREALNKTDDLRLVGFQPVHKKEELKAGAHFLNIGEPADMAHDLGYLTSVAYSPTLGHSIGLGFLKNGQARIGERVRAFNPMRQQDIEVEIVSPHFIDPKGERQRG